MDLQYSELTSPHCSKCGAETIRECPSCRSSIRGNYYVEGVIDVSDDPIPAYCHSCGSAYPWTRTALDSAKELVEELDQLDRDEKNKLNGPIGELLREPPQAQVAAVRFKKLIKKAGGASAPPSVPADLPTHRRRGPAQLVADLSQRRPAGQAAGDGLPLRQRQCETGPLARRRGDPACPRHLIPHDLGDPAQRTTDGIQRFPVSPPAPQFRLLRRRQTWATSLHHETSSLLGSCCIDPLNAPQIGSQEIGSPKNPARFGRVRCAGRDGTRWTHRPACGPSRSPG